MAPEPRGDDTLLRVMIPVFKGSGQERLANATNVTTDERLLRVELITGVRVLQRGEVSSWNDRIEQDVRLKHGG